jgi:hypothetical protein
MLEDRGGDIAVTDEELVEWLQHERPDLLAVLQETKFTGGLRPSATRAAQGLHDRGGEVDAAELIEALGSDEGSKLLDEAVRESFARVVAPALQDLVEAALEDERDLLRAEGRADSERIMEIRDLRDKAREMITESKLPETFQAELIEKYDLVDGKPTPALDVIAEEDEETGEVKKPAVAVLAENIEADIARKREQAAELRPTRVRGQGEGKPAEAEGGEPATKKVEESKNSTGSPRTDAILQEAGIEADDELYAGILR